MFGGNRLLMVTFVAGALFAAAPATASASCGGGVSAVSVYSECVPTASGGKATSGGTSGAQGSGTAPLTKQEAIALKHAGKDKRVLSSLVQGYAAAHAVKSPNVEATAEPSAIHSAFDLGPGPTALLVVLVGGALALLVAVGLRHRRH